MQLLHLLDNLLFLKYFKLCYKCRIQNIPKMLEMEHYGIVLSPFVEYEQVILCRLPVRPNKTVILYKFFGPAICTHLNLCQQ